jgi:uncharacterized protein (TIGR02145 family)
MCFVLLLFALAAYGQQLTDSRDGKKYRVVTIGTQTWMAENLNYNINGSECYDDKPANCEKYGRLYNWETTMEACPKGWHLPSNDEWDVLINFVGGLSTAGTKLKAKSGWNSNKGKAGNGTDDLGFAALPGGRGYIYGKHNSVGSRGYWWSATGGTYGAYCQYIYYDEDVYRYYDSDHYLHSVRCVKD